MPKSQLNETPTEESEGERLNFNNSEYKFVPGNHTWVQRGYYLMCTSCDLGHGIFVGADKLMVGTDDKGPILKTRKELNMA